MISISGNDSKPESWQLRVSICVDVLNLWYWESYSDAVTSNPAFVFWSLFCPFLFTDCFFNMLSNSWFCIGMGFRFLCSLSEKAQCSNKRNYELQWITNGIGREWGSCGTKTCSNWNSFIISSWEVFWGDLESSYCEQVFCQIIISQFLYMIISMSSWSVVKISFIES